MDPAKLKVVELRSELQARGLDTKGNKPVLVKRLKEALEAELQTDLPDTSIADTSTEDCGSQDEECMAEESTPQVQKESATLPETEVTQSDPTFEPQVQEPEDASIVTNEVEPEPSPETIEPIVTESSEETNKDKEEPTKEPTETENALETEQLENSSETEQQEKVAAEEEHAQEVTNEIEKVEQNGDSANGEAEEESCEPKAKKSRWGAETDVAVETPNEDAPAAVVESTGDEHKQEKTGKKRKHSSPSPDRNQRQRSKSPIREDEPAVDANKVQLSWYDSDLHLQIDKTHFLSAKPLNDGLFGYIWSGARVTHGVKANKACYEVKLTEELQFENILSGSDRKDNRRDRRDSRREDRGNSRSTSSNGCEESLKSNEANKPDSTDARKLEEKDETSLNDSEPATEPKALEIDEVSAASDANEKMDTFETESKEAADELEKVEADQNQPTEALETTPQDSNKLLEDKLQAPTETELVKVPPHLIRIGWSSSKASLQLGEDKLSFGLESSGKFYANNTIISTGATFKVGDVIRAFVDMFTHELNFAVNGVLSFKYQIDTADIEDVEEFVLFPHVMTRNVAFEINTGDREEPMSVTPEDFTDYTFLAKLEMTVSGPTALLKREECEVIVMCGLPGAGKTHWVEEYIKTATKSYNLIGSSYLMNRMTVDGKTIRGSISNDRMSTFWNKMQKSLNRLGDLAPLRRRDFILDLTNVFPAALRRKMRAFLGFKRHAVIVVNEDEEQEKRLKQQDPETGKDMSMSALLEMKANMGLPKVGESFEQVTYASLAEDKAQEQVNKYNKQGRDGGFGNMGHHRRDHRDDRNNRWHNRGSGGNGGGGPRRDYQNRNNYRDRPYSNNRYDRNYRQSGGSGGGGGSWRSGGDRSSGNWGSRNDRRDNRGPRDWRSNNRSGGGMNDRPQHRGGNNRDHRSHSNSSGGNYNRNRNQSGSVGGGGRWGSSQSGGWSSQGGGSWNNSHNQDWNAGWNQSQGSWNQNQWKYGGGYNQGGYSQYPPNWNSYYGSNSYSQDWSGSNSVGHEGGGNHTTSATTNTSNSNSFAPSSSMMASQLQQDTWSQYSHQYTSSSTSNANSQK